ncbi:hypothetical protein SAMN06265360_102192 [Haloechinothrix alba]|uniref:Small secreted protein n=1 Tax=Haloechinothrix alba TaxID=664784 RepID=A0A238VFC6_9PSEU|nr:hypothetical protein [Haloechinothrix alba]SNR33090.1 hypothetical protein SAMN06265360_102192 [Haloechinothrix alba]
MLRSRTAVAGAVLATLLAAGCGSDDGAGEPPVADSSGTPEQDGASNGADVDDEVLAWTGTICTALQDSGAAIEMPEIDPTHPESAREGFLDFLGSLDTEFGSLDDTLRDVGPPPVDGGEDTYDAAMETLQESREAVQEAMVSLEEAEVTDEESFQAAVVEAGAKMEELGSRDGPSGDLRENPALEAAFQEASECRNV